MNRVILILAIFMAFPAFAAGGQKKADDNPLAKDQNLKLLCKEMVKHLPRDDVEHKPDEGVVVQTESGFFVSSYDYPIDIPLELDLLKRFDLDVPVGIFSDPEVAGVKIYEGGHVEYNGHDITPEAQYFCQKNLPAETHEKDVKKNKEAGEDISDERH